MSELKIYADCNGTLPLRHFTRRSMVKESLSAMGVRFEQWSVHHGLTDDADEQAVLNVYRDDIKQLMRDEGYQSFDIIRCQPSILQRPKDRIEERQKFLVEHTHTDDEVRFFVAGHGVFYLHLDGRVYEVHCQQGDLLSVPANTPHWFDMGLEPDFTAIRLFNSPKGWEAQYTGSDIAHKFNRARHQV